MLRRALVDLLPETEVFIVDSFPIPICDFKRAKTSKSDLKWADASGTLATYGHYATKSLATFLGFRRHVIPTGTGVPVDFAIASETDRDDRDVLPLLSERYRYPVLLGDKGCISGPLQEELLETENTC